MEPHSSIGVGEAVIRLGIVVLLVAANGFFVASEFSLVGARKTHIEALARKGNRRAKLARSAIQHLDHYISGTQLGITLASLGLGWVAESTLAALIIQWFDGLGSPWDFMATHAAAGTLAFAFITFLHIVLGELAPKTVALVAPEATAMWTAGPLIAFSRLLTPFIAFLNGSANLLLRAIGMRPASEIERVHRPEEIEMLVKQMYQHGSLSEEPVEMIRSVFDLSETTAGEVMTPRTEVVAIPDDATVDEAADVYLECGHSRLPVYDGSIDRITGLLIARDVWGAQRSGKREIRPLIRPIMYIPDSKSVEDLLREMQLERAHMAVVVDEFGGTAGVVTMEDLVEEIVGEISDEHEMERPPIEERAPNEVSLDGGITLAELNYEYSLGLPEDEYTTVAGYIMGVLGRIADVGDDAAFAGGTFRVLEMDGRRIARVLLQLEEPELEEEAAGE